MTEHKSCPFDDLDQETAELIRTAERALVNAYAPYSHFRVGAALLLENGNVVTGTNQENAAYPSGMCAERVALFSAASSAPGVMIRKIAIVAKRENAPSIIPVTPCGSCRQVLLEFEVRQKKPVQVVLQIAKDQWLRLSSAGILLPYSFTKSDILPESSEQ